jgi:hypothetical protein
MQEITVVVKRAGLRLTLSVSSQRRFIGEQLFRLSPRKVGRYDQK